MTNVWIAKDANSIKLTTIDGQVFSGIVVDITDVGEESEDYGFGEDSITINCSGKHIVFPQSDITSIEIIN